KTAPQPRTGMPSPRLTEEAFKERFRSQFQDPNFVELRSELEKIAQAAWDTYEHSRKAPKTRKAGPNYADPDYDLSEDWIAAHDAIAAAAQRFEDKNRPL